MKLRNDTTFQAGFSLVEVMVALLVVSIGMLGIAKMQALALSSTGTAKMRSLASIEAASLASTIHADRRYWFYIPSALTVTVSSAGAVASTQDSTLNSTAAARPAACTAVPPATPCTAAQIAAQDLGEWADGIIGILPPNSASTITCNAPTATLTVECRIDITWTENVVTSDIGQSSSATQAQNSSALQGITSSRYTLYVDP
ncbi:MAG TPA: prepilin-type N-terminal cleavage/methylation domain-containing protein [Steroidobacteraceae bacterium]